MEEKQVQISVQDNDLRGVYSNAMQIVHTKEEFCLDFFNIFPPKPILVSRILMSPAHLKRMIKALSENIEKYESQHGLVEAAKEPETNLGFKP